VAAWADLAAVKASNNALRRVRGPRHPVLYGVLQKNCCRMHSRRRVQVLQNHGGPDEIGGSKSLGEAAARRRKQIGRRIAPAFGLPQLGKADRRSQLPRQGSLPTRGFDRPQHQRFGPVAVPSARPEQPSCANAKQFRCTPAGAAGFATCENLIVRQCVGKVTDAGARDYNRLHTPTSLDADGPRRRRTSDRDTQSVPEARSSWGTERRPRFTRRCDSHVQ